MNPTPPPAFAAAWVAAAPHARERSPALSAVCTSVSRPPPATMLASLARARAREGSSPLPPSFWHALQLAPHGGPPRRKRFMHGHALRAKSGSNLMSACSALATPSHRVSLVAGGPPAGGGGGAPSGGAPARRVGGGVGSRGAVSKRARLAAAPVRVGSIREVAWSCGRGHVVMRSRSCGRGHGVAVMWSRGRVVMRSRGHVVAWSCGRVVARSRGREVAWLWRQGTTDADPGSVYHALGPTAGALCAGAGKEGKEIY